MTFVYPLLLGGLLLAGLPVLLHFLIRQKPKTLVFPAFRFLMQKRRSNTRNLRLRHLLLLLLRIALLVLLCLALARPRLFHAQLGLSREKPVALALVFDTSASMGYKVNDVTRLELAKKRSLELLDQLPGDCRVLILDSSDSANYGRADWLKSLELARQRIKALTIRPDSTPVTKAIDEAHRRFDEWDRTGDEPEAARLPRLVCVFTDRTKASWEGSASPKRETRDDAVKVQAMLFDVGIDDPVDVAITQVALPAHYLGGMVQSFAEGERVPLSVVVKATGKEFEGEITCQVGDLKMKQNLTVPAGEQGTRRFEIDTKDLAPGLHQAELKLGVETDQLAFNNRWFVTFEIRKPQRVLVLADDVKNAAPFVKMLRACLYAVDTRSVRDEKWDFGTYDAVFLDGVADPSNKLWDALAEHVKSGRGLGIITGGDAMNVDAYNGASAQKLMPAMIAEKTGPAAGYLGRWNDAALNLDHPLFRRFQSWFIASDGVVGMVGNAFHYRKLKSQDRDATVLIRFDDDRPALIERTLPKGGTVLLLTTPLDPQTPAWNDYASSLRWGLPVLTMLCARHLCRDVGNPTLNHEFGKAPPKVAQRQGYEKYLLTGPDVAEEIRMDGAWIGDRLPSAGNYALLGVTGQDQVALTKFSINVPGQESDLSRVPVSDIEAVLGVGAVVPQDRKTALPDTLNWDEPIELFPWLMLVLLFLLALENLLANKFYRQDAPLAA
jgi:hypothetical protein